jgi:hypothetical protein
MFATAYPWVARISRPTATTFQISQSHPDSLCIKDLNLQMLNLNTFATFQGAHIRTEPFYTRKKHVSATIQVKMYVALLLFGAERIANSFIKAFPQAHRPAGLHVNHRLCEEDTQGY